MRRASAFDPQDVTQYLPRNVQLSPRAVRSFTRWFNDQVEDGRITFARVVDSQTAFENALAGFTNESSRQGSIQIYLASGTLRYKVFRFIARQGRWGATNEEIEEGLDLKRPNGSSRRGELESMGLVKPTNDRRQSRAEVALTVYKLTSLGRKVWEDMQ